VTVPERPRLVLVLTENWTLVPSEDPLALVELAREAEAAGIDAVMLSEHVVLGAAAGANGLMGNPRDYALPGNQDPATPWPSSIVLLSAIAAATTSLRLAAAAILAPLRHPLLLARELGTLDLLSRGRLVVLPSVGWHEQEYEALGVDFRRRGRMLDEQLAVWERAWGKSPMSFEGEHYRFDEVWLEPGAFRPSGPRLWFGGGSVHPALIRRMAAYGSGYNPLGTISDEELAQLADGLRQAGRDPAEIEMVGGLRGTFPDHESTADLAEAVDDAVPRQLARGFASFCFKPNQFIDDVADWSELCREAVARGGEAAERQGGVEAAHAAWAATGARA
jgi:probable F420-dependent oxidoreductase